MTERLRLNIGALMFLFVAAFPFLVGAIGYFLFWISVLKAAKPWLGTIPYGRPSTFSLDQLEAFNEELARQFVMSVHIEYSNLVNSAVMIALIAAFGLKKGQKWAWWVLLFIGLWAGLNDVTAQILGEVLVLAWVPTLVGVAALIITYPAIFDRMAPEPAPRPKPQPSPVNARRRLWVGALLVMAAGMFPMSLGSLKYVLFWVSVENANEPWLAQGARPASYTLDEVQGFNREFGQDFVFGTQIDAVTLMAVGAAVVLIALSGLRRGREWAWWALFGGGVWLGGNALEAMWSREAFPLVLIPVLLWFSGLSITFTIIFQEQWPVVKKGIVYALIMAVLMAVLVFLSGKWPNFYLIFGILFGAIPVVLLIIAEAAAKLNLSGNQRFLINLVSSAYVLGWFGLASVLGVLCVFCAEPDRLPRIWLGIAFAVITGIIVFCMPISHRLLKVTPVYWLIGYQFFRIVGVSFLADYFRGVMPAIFSFTLGLSDVIVGVSAPLIAYYCYRKKPRWRSLAIQWNLGGLGILFVVIFIVTFNMTSPVQFIITDPNVDQLTHFAMVLAPLFGLALFMLIHIFTLWLLLNPRLAADERSGAD